MNSTISKLITLSISSCTCLTKSPLPSYHSIDCKYRITLEVISEVENLIAVNETLTKQLLLVTNENKQNVQP
jgi:hypothetical protein